MMGRADKGIILTTGTFTVEARKEAVRDGVPPIELVDGEKILEMCEELVFGLKPKKTFDKDLIRRCYLYESNPHVTLRVSDPRRP